MESSNPSLIGIMPAMAYVELEISKAAKTLDAWGYHAKARLGNSNSGEYQTVEVATCRADGKVIDFDALVFSTNQISSTEVESFGADLRTSWSRLCRAAILPTN